MQTPLSSALPPRSNAADVVFALFVREVKTRAGGRLRLGYVSTLAEPIVHVLVLLFVFGAVGKLVLPGVDILAFFAVSVVHFLYFRTAVDRIGNAIVANRPLFYYRQVQPAYAIAARAGFELLLHIAVSTALLLVAFVIGADISLSGAGLLAISNLLFFGLSLGIGTLQAVGSARWPESRTVITNGMRLLYYVSCVFYPLALVPGTARELFLLNPLVHVLEMTRESLLPGYSMPEDVSFTYPAVFVVVILFLSFASYRVSARRLRTA